jgi:hypothetical protein
MLSKSTFLNFLLLISFHEAKYISKTIFEEDKVWGTLVEIALPVENDYKTS